MSRTDIDLIDPAEGQRFGWVGGVHYAEGIDAGRMTVAGSVLGTWFESIVSISSFI